MIINEITLGFFMIIVTVVLHGVALDRLVYILERPKLKYIRTIESMTIKITMMSLIISYIFLSHAAQIWLWGFCYQKIGALPDFETAIYFSTSVFTTVGFGDIYLDKEWRLLSSFEAANGFILFGWSTAFIFESMARIYDKDKQKYAEAKQS